MPELPLFQRARSHPHRAAVIAGRRTFTYGDLMAASGRVASHLLEGRSDLDEARVGYLVPPGFTHVAVQWGIWRAGGVAVPLGLSHPAPELRYVLEDADASIIVAHPEFEDVARSATGPRARRLVSTSDSVAASPTAMPDVGDARRAMIIYTSGTTGKPKGVVTSHANIEAQVASLISAWEWCAEDHILLVLPLHHVHGIINVMTCALWAGARCEMLPRFDAGETWASLVESPITLFMAVPTIYRRLVAAWDEATPARRTAMSDACGRLRLMVSGSAALPVGVLERWKEVSGHTLLERYGMTEIGMGLSNPLHGERRPGHVGTPLPGVQVKLVDEGGDDVEPGASGEIRVRGPGIFLEYWGRADETRDAFEEGWFRTGDVAVIEDGSYRILGRTNVDIIKTAGYKVSALEIEEVLRTHPAIEECAVVGVEDADLGESVCVAVELRSGHAIALDTLRAWAKERLAPYKVPRALLDVSLPRSAMGKVLKDEVAAMFADGPHE